MYEYDYGKCYRYSADIAQNDYEEKEQRKGKQLKIGNDIELANYIEHKIADERYSPEAVLIELKNKNGKMPFCKTTLYSYIEKGVFLNLTNDDLIYKAKNKKRYKKVRQARLPKGVSIERRPKEIESRLEFGHWEMDSVVGKSKGKKQTLLVLSERKTRYQLIFKMADKSSKSVVRALNRIEKQLPFHRIFKSITVDNGCEFQDCYGMEYGKGKKKRTTVYYCHPYCASERGTNENQNRMIRRFYPKGMSLQRVTDSDCKKVQGFMNNYPRKILNNRTAAEMFDLETKDILINL